MTTAWVRAATGALTVAAIAAVAAVSAVSFEGGFAPSVPITVLSPRAGLVMNPDAKVQFHGVLVGRVETIDELPSGLASLRLAMDPTRLGAIPENAIADITSTTVFGAKTVQLVMPADPSATAMRPGQVLQAQQVMIEINTVFEQLVSVLSAIRPEKLNETLGAIAAATNGNGQQVGTLLTDLNSLLGQINPHLGALGHDLEVAPAVFGAYADAAPDLLAIAGNATTISRTLVDEQNSLDAALLSATGLANVGTEVLTQNRGALADTLRFLVPTTQLTNQYNEALHCGLSGIVRMATNPPLPQPGINILAGLLWGQDRYRYPQNIPKVAAKGGPQCTDLPVVPFQTAPPFVVTDVGANPWQYNNPGIVLNSDGLKQLLFGPIDGPPRNVAQIGQPG
jgi:virulence factor Mce-like protein